jgi:nicotinamidase-related amidase
MSDNSNLLPLTLRQLSVASSTPASLADSVILVIDAQKEYTEGLIPLEGINESIDALSAFIAKARGLNVPIIHIIHIGKSGSKIFNPDGSFVEIIDKVKPVEGESIVKKNLPSSFKGTTLEEELIKVGRKNLIITGYMTHMCVNSTTRDAVEAGYHCTIVSELTTTRNLPDGKGGIIPASVVKEVNLASLADRFAIIVDKSTDIL